jgi:hypothetical protein
MRRFQPRAAADYNGAVISRAALSAAVLILCVLAGARAQGADLGRFAGEWIGTQRWAQSNPPAGAEPQQVTLTLEASEGKLSGTLMPFFGGGDGALLTDIRIDGKQLRADAVLGEARIAQSPENAEPFWKNDVKIAFAFTDEGDGKLSGTANLTMGGVQWLKFQYALTRKEARP